MLPDDLPGCHQAYEQLKRQILNIGFICVGTVLRRYGTCGTPTCRCHGNPPQLHGPYYQWTRKVRGKTVTVRLKPRESEIYAACAANRQALQAIIDQMEAVSMQAIKLQLAQQS